MNTLFLNPGTWDLVLDASANIAMAAAPYALAQDAASAIRTFLGECWYDTTLGVPYWEQILGKNPSIELMKELFADAAAVVPGVVEVKVFILSVTDRTVGGQVQITDKAGNLSAANF